MTHNKDERRVWLWMLALLVAGLVILCIPGCGKAAARNAEITLPKTGTVKPKTAQGAREQAGDLRGQIDDLQLQVAQLEREAKILEKQEFRARMVIISRIVMLVSALAGLAGIALFWLSFSKPYLKWIRSLAGTGAALAGIVFGLAFYLPDAIVWLGPLAILATVGTGVWFVYRFVRDQGGFAATVKLVERQKDNVALPDERRKQIQTDVIGKNRRAVDGMRKKLGLT